MDAVVDVLKTLEPPPFQWMGKVPSTVKSALEIFIGYVMLDAWIANQDRHHQNWAALQDDKLRLAPTFDHGASLARNISDEERHERLTTDDRNRRVAPFAERAKSAFYGDAASSRPLKTKEAFSAFARHAPAASQSWLDRLRGVELSSVQKIINGVPPQRMSGVAKEFTLQLLAANQKRLLERV